MGGILRHHGSSGSTIDLDRTNAPPVVQRADERPRSIERHCRARQDELPLTYAEPAGPAPSVQHVEPPSRNRFRRRLVLADAVAILAGAGAAFVAWMLLSDISPTVVRGHALLFALTYPVWIMMFMVARLYVARVVTRRAEEFRRIWVACATSTIVTVVIAFAIQYSHLSRSWISLLLFSVGSMMVVERAIARRVFSRLRRTGRMSRRIAIIGTGPLAIDMNDRLQRDRSLGYSVAGLIGDTPPRQVGAEWLGPIADAEALLVEHECTGALVSLASVASSDVNRLVRSLTDRGFHIALSSSLRDIDTTRVRPQSLDGQTLLYIEPVIRDGWRARAKRMFDVGLAAFATVLSAPIVLFAAGLIKLDSRGPVFFRQMRVGRDGVQFEMLKLRTMQVDAEARLDAVLATNERTGPLFKSATDPRVTRVGRFLRKWSIDEIPQFYNVLRGDMSVVGPRPALPREVAEWDPQTRERLRALPGITGLWQVEGRDNASFDVYKRLDLFYVDNWSLLHDMRIVSRTFGAVVARRGAV